MTKLFHLAAAALVAILVCSVAGAQMRGGASAMRMPSVHVAPAARFSSAGPRAIPRTVRQARLVQISPTGRLTAGSSRFANSVSFGSANGVPGLGFDYPHLAAINGALRNNARANFGRGGHRRQNTIVPILIGGYGYPYYYPGDYYADTSDEQQPQQQPQDTVQQPAPASRQDAYSGNDTAYPPTPPAAAPVRDVGDFLLVRRDGRILFASAFSVGGAQLTYVTPEGIRRSLPLAELDADATQQMNEARGTTVQIRN